MFMCPQNSYAVTLTPKCDDMERQGPGEVIRSRESHPHEWDECLHKRDPRDSLPTSAM